MRNPMAQLVSSTPTRHSVALAVRTVLGILATAALGAALLAPPASAAGPVQNGDEDLVTSADGRLPKIGGLVHGQLFLNIFQTEVPAGRYKLVVRDRTTNHNFHFAGPGGVDVTTT